MTRKVLFVGYGGGHIAMLLPVMRALREQLPSVQCMLLALTTGYKPALAAGERPMGYKDLMHLVDTARAMAWGARLQAGNSSPDVSREESLAYLGINYLDLIAQHGEAGAAELFERTGRYGFMPLHFMGRVIDELKPDMVVATNSPRTEAAALRSAVRRKIPSLGMVDLFGLDGDDYVRRAVRPDWTCVLAPTVRDRLLAHGFDAERVIATGNPAFDGLQSPANHELARQFIRRQGWKGLSPLLWAGQREPAHVAGAGTAFAHGVESTLRALVERCGDLALIVRYHPGEWHLFERLPDSPRIHFSVPLQEPIHPLILCASAVVVQNSTVGLEAAVAGKPVISMEESVSVRTSFSLAAMGVSVPCAAREELPKILEQLLSSPATVPSPYASDGRAADRVAAVVVRALGTQRF